MQTKTKVISLTVLLAGAVVFGMILAGGLDLTRGASAEKAVAAPAAAATHGAPAAMGLPSFADLAEEVIPAVVSVRSTDIVKPEKRRVPFHNFGGEGNPFDYFFGPGGPKRGQQDEEEDRKELSGGTGFIIEPDGFVLTNNHVVENADKVEVLYGEKDDVYSAKVIGRDPATDLALLKIEGTKPFAVVKLGDSDRLRVGDWAMAIGDPLNFEKTVTVGVISGKGRQAGLSRISESAAANHPLA